MSRWLVNARGQQFSASGLDELKKLARQGEFGGGDIVQPPGASDWLYAVEVPELKGSLRADLDIMDTPPPKPEMSPALKYAGAAVLAVASVAAWGYALSLRSTIPQAEDLELIGGKQGLTYSQVLATTDAPIRSSASESGSSVGTLARNAKADLLAKNDKFYKVRSGGAEGYVKVDEVVPAYFFADERTKQDYDPLYNPDKYAYVVNSSWRMSEEPGKDNVSVFSFMMENTSKFQMTDIKLRAVIKNEKDEVLEEQVIPVEGKMPPLRSIMVGTLLPAKGETESRILMTSEYEQLLQADPKVEERWMDGVEVPLKQAIPGSEATITLMEVRAVPPDQMPSSG